MSDQIIERELIGFIGMLQHQRRHVEVARLDKEITIAKVRQNLAWAFDYNLIVLPIASGALLPAFGLRLTPPLAALLMAMSSITVVVNALWLQRQRGSSPIAPAHGP